ncbi:unnamed protein product [Effrenium voratum]|nr:unnamed protein product [Effrenium voratum]
MDVDMLDDAPLLPWVEKYRPSSLDQLVAHEDIIRMIERMIVKKTLPHMLLHGPPGTGKTSTITAVAKTMYKQRYKSMTLEMNASDARGIDVVREQIKTFVSVKQLFASAEGQPKLVILDEADNMTSSAQFALRRMIEQYASNCRFILICNYSSKIIPALQSRCTKLRFAPLTEEQMLGRLQYIAETEKTQLTQDGAKAIVQVGGGDMRKVINIFQTTSMGHRGNVDSKAVYASTGIPSPEDVRQSLQYLVSSCALCIVGHSLPQIARTQLSSSFTKQSLVKTKKAISIRFRLGSVTRTRRWCFLAFALVLHERV